MVKLKSQERKGLAKWVMELRLTLSFRGLLSQNTCCISWDVTGFLNTLSLLISNYTSGKVPCPHFIDEEAELRQLK